MHPADMDRPNEPYSVHLAKTMNFGRIKLDRETSK